MKTIITTSIAMLFAINALANTPIEFSNCTEAKSVFQYYIAKHHSLAEIMRRNESYRTRTNVMILDSLMTHIVSSAQYILDNNCK